MNAAPVDGASLAVFHIAFGSIVLWEIWRYCSADWIGRYYIRPEFHFKHYGFEGIVPWPGAGMYSHFAVLGVLAALILVGAFYRQPGWSQHEDQGHGPCRASLTMSSRDAEALRLLAHGALKRRTQVEAAAYA